MTSPLATLDAQRVFYFDAVISDSLQSFEPIQCFTGEDLKLVFKAKNANGEEVDLTGADITFKAVQTNCGNTTALMSKSVGSGITISGSEATVLMNVDDLGETYTTFNAQLVITKTGKSVVAAKGRFETSKVYE